MHAQYKYGYFLLAMNILMTGANGFVGQYLNAELSSAHHVKTLCFSTYNSSEQLGEVDIVIHLAALVHQMEGAPEEYYFRINTEKTIDLAKRAKESGVKHFIFMSTIKVYGEKTASKPFNENSPCHPEDAYGRSKLSAEKVLRDMEDENFTVSIIRSPLIYGEHVKANMLNLMTLIKKVPILPFGGIFNKRSLVYVGNLVAMIQEIIIQQKSGVFLASDKHPVSTTQLVEMLADAMGKKRVLISLPSLFRKFLSNMRPALYERLFGNLEIDNRQTLQVLHFSPPFTTKEGISSMVKYYMDNLNGKEQA